MKLRSWSTVAAAAFVCTLAVVASATAGTSGPGQLTVMTQNLYMGTDLDPVIGATTLPKLLAAAGAAFQQVERTDFSSRAAALARAEDLNSPADGSGAPSYRDLLTDGFDDGWLGAPHLFDNGFTCCESGDLTSPLPQLSSRIDDVLTRGGAHVLLEGRVGVLPLEKTRNGLWPSDHAGVVALVRLDS